MMLYKEGEPGFVGLDIGCGRRPKEGWRGYDLVPDDEANIQRYDMRDQHLPYADNTVDAIRCINTLEHVERSYYRFIFNEWYRVLKLEGILEFIVPNVAKSVTHAWGDITHLSAWVPDTVMYLTGERPRYATYGFLPWEKLKCEDLDTQEKDLHVILRTRLDAKTNKKYGNGV